MRLKEVKQKQLEENQNKLNKIYLLKEVKSGKETIKTQMEQLQDKKGTLLILNNPKQQDIKKNKKQKWKKIPNQQN